MGDKLISSISLILQKIINVISSKDNNIINIIGNSGTGKSYLLNEVYEKIQKRNNETIVLKGDDSKKEIDFYPLNEFLEKTIKIRKLGKDIVSNLFEEIPVVGKSLKVVIDSIDVESYMHKKDILDISELRQHREFSLYLISALHKDNNVFVLCDDIQYFDEKTLCYLNDIILRFKKLEYPPIIFISTVNTSNIMYRHSFLEGKSVDFLLSLPQKDEIRDIMSFWGLKRNLNNKDIEMIYASTGGHLYLLYSIMEYLQLYDEKTDFLTRSNSLLLKIIETRLFSFGNSYHEAKNILCCLSYIGEQVSRDEISCVLNNPTNLNTILNISSNQNLLLVKDDYVFFCHEIIRKAFYNLNNRNDSSDFYVKFSNCIKKISPSQYAKRAIIETKAGNLQQADILFSLYACQKMRNGLFSEIKNITEKLSSNLCPDILEFIEELTHAYQLTFEGKDIEALSLLLSTNCIYPYPLWIEKQYLACSLQYKSNSKSNRVDALQTIEELISNVQDDEFEIWSRCMILKQILERDLNLVDNAKKTRNTFQCVLSKRLCFDKESLRMLNVLEMYSDTIDTHEVAHLKLLKLVSRLENEITNKNYDLIFDLYVAESNLSGNSLIIGNYDTAYQSAIKALRMVEQFSCIHFSHIEVCFNNMYLALFNLERTPKEEIIDKYTKLLSIRTDEDKTLVITNYAGLLLSNGDKENAKKIMEKISEYDINIDTDTDAYYAYYYKFNSAMILYFNDFKDEAFKILYDIKSLIPYVSKNAEKYYIKHYDSVCELLLEKDFESINELQQDFTTKTPIFLGSIWNRFKHVYLFSELQIWTQF